MSIAAICLMAIQSVVGVELKPISVELPSDKLMKGGAVKAGGPVQFATTYYTGSNWGDQVEKCNNERQSPQIIKSVDAVQATDTFNLESGTLGMAYFTTSLEAKTKGKLEDGSDYGYWALELKPTNWAPFLSIIERNDEQYHLVAAHIHVGRAEHVIDNTKTDACAHFIHAKSPGNYVVYEVQYVNDDEAEFEFPFGCPQDCGIEHSNAAFGDENDGLICPAEITLPGPDLDPSKDFFHTVFGTQTVKVDDFYGYDGHLTTPDCDNNVFFMVYKSVVPVRNLTDTCKSVAAAFPREESTQPAGNWRRQFAQWAPVYDLAGTQSSARRTITSLATVLTSMSVILALFC